MLQNLLKEALGRLGQNGGNGRLRHAVGAENVLRQLDEALAHLCVKGVHRVVHQHPADAPARHQVTLGEAAARQHRRLLEEEVRERRGGEERGERKREGEKR